MTIKEAALIQSFPLNYIFKGPKSSIYTQIGNAVPSKLAEAVARSAVDLLLNKKKPIIEEETPYQMKLETVLYGGINESR